MLYLKALEDCSFFGESFNKDELLTLREARKWIEKQENKYAEPFIANYFRPVYVNQKNTYFFFGYRLEKEKKIF